MVSTTLTSLILAASLFTSMVQGESEFSGTSVTSMYYDCCKPACAWPKAASFISQLKTCQADNSPVREDTAGNYCGGGPASSCLEQTPWAINDTFSYGFASIFLSSAPDAGGAWCCSCYLLEFTDSEIKGKRMIVQGVNNNFNEDQKNYFSLTVPGQADWKNMCAERFGGTFDGFFGKGSQGLDNITQCAGVPEELRESCEWRYSWYKDVELPNATFTRVRCPAELVKKSGCNRTDDNSFLAEPLPSSATITTKTSPVVVMMTVLLLFFVAPQYI